MTWNIMSVKEEFCTKGWTADLAVCETELLSVFGLRITNFIQAQVG